MSVFQENRRTQTKRGGLFLDVAVLGVLVQAEGAANKADDSHPGLTSHESLQVEGLTKKLALQTKVRPVLHVHCS